MNKLVVDTNITIAMMGSAVLVLIGGVMWLTNIDITARASVTAIERQKETQEETNRLILNKLDIVNDKLTQLAVDVAVVKRLNKGAKND